MLRGRRFFCCRELNRRPASSGKTGSPTSKKDAKIKEEKWGRCWTNTRKTFRKPNQEELCLIRFLVQKASLNMSEGWERSLTVSCLNDGGMGSMKLYMSLPPKEIISTIFVSECSFKDSDGIDVLASLYLDQDHEICEVDIWKADFSPLIRISSDISL